MSGTCVLLREFAPRNIIIFIKSLGKCTFTKSPRAQKKKSLIKICTRDSCTFQLLREPRSVSLITCCNEIDLSAVATFVEGHTLGVISHQEYEVNTVFNLVCEVCKWYSRIILSEHMEMF